MLLKMWHYRFRKSSKSGNGENTGQYPRKCGGGNHGDYMADLYLKALESERKSLWAACRLKGLAKDTSERRRIAELDMLLEAHKAKKGA